MVGGLRQQEDGADSGGQTLGGPCSALVAVKNVTSAGKPVIVKYGTNWDRRSQWEQRDSFKAVSTRERGGDSPGWWQREKLGPSYAAG